MVWLTGFDRWFIGFNKGIKTFYRCYDCLLTTAAEHHGVWMECFTEQRYITFVAAFGIFINDLGDG